MSSGRQLLVGYLTRLDLAYWPDLAILPPIFTLAQSSKFMDFNNVSFFFSFGIFTAITGWGQQSELVMLPVNTDPHEIGIGDLEWLTPLESKWSIYSLRLACYLLWRP